MEFTSQSNCLQDLQLLSSDNRHSLLIAGPSGSGKTYLAGQYADMLGVSDFQMVKPLVSDIRDRLDLCIQFGSPIVLCIENLDLGLPAASYTLLKNLEEPQENLYIVVTCRNIRKVPSTIISRCVCVEVDPPLMNDLGRYAKLKDSTKFNSVKNTPLWKTIRSFQDIDTVFNMTVEEQEYILNYPNILEKHDSIGNIQWALCHYANNKELPLELCMRYLLDTLQNPYHIKRCIDCLNDISDSRIASHAAVAEFVLEYKYGG